MIFPPCQIQIKKYFINIFTLIQQQSITLFGSNCIKEAPSECWTLCPSRANSFRPSTVSGAWLEGSAIRRVPGIKFHGLPWVSGSFLPMEVFTIINFIVKELIKISLTKTSINIRYSSFFMVPWPWRWSEICGLPSSKTQISVVELTVSWGEELQHDRKNVPKRILSPNNSLDSTEGF